MRSNMGTLHFNMQRKAEKTTEQNPWDHEIVVLLLQEACE